MIGTWESRRDTIATHAWETWTKNGLHMDREDLVESGKSAADAATNAYVDGASDMEWLAATLKRLGHTPLP